ncbi:hypothetical protein Q4I32_003811 [Leishmania shawi]|uniref:Uncharacterized protein n=1 Tax=Leishmania shawi TaxID=5680 RepID=A0AAW3BVB6_9TRYP
MSVHAVEESDVGLPNMQLEHHEQAAQQQPRPEPSNAPTQVCIDKTVSRSPSAKRYRFEEQEPKDISADAVHVIDLKEDAHLEHAGRASATVALQDDHTDFADAPVGDAAAVVDVSCSTLCAEADVTGVSDETLAEPDLATVPAYVEEMCALTLSVCELETSSHAQLSQVMPHAVRKDIPVQPLLLEDGNAVLPPLHQCTDEEEAVVSPLPVLTEALTHLSQTEGTTESGAIAHDSVTIGTEDASRCEAEESLCRDTEAGPVANTANATEVASRIPVEGEKDSLRSARSSEAATPPPSLAAVDEYPKEASKHLTFASDALPQSLSQRGS